MVLFLSLVNVQDANASSIVKVTASNDTVTITFDDVVYKASVFSLAGPNRIALDVEGIDSLDSTNRNTMPDGLVIRSIRWGQYNSSTARLVFDLDRPAIVTGGKFSSDGKKLFINVRNATDEEFASTLGKGKKIFSPPVNFRSEPPNKDYAVLARIKKNSNLDPQIYGPKDSNLPLVVIDAGHGGHDTGEISPYSGLREKSVNLAIAKRIRDRLATTGSIRVALTRENDKFLVLKDRFGIARKLGADLYISIHADASENAQVNGGAVYGFSEIASDRVAQKLASRENKADIINGINLGGTDNNVSSILIDLTRRETMNASVDFAKILLREAKPNMRLRYNSHRFASFVVLKARDVPSILFETGYLTNKQDVEFLSTINGQSKIADIITKSVQLHFANQ